MPEKSPNTKRIRALAGDLAAAGMAAGMFTNYKPEDVASYCLAAATAIVNAEIDTD